MYSHDSHQLAVLWPEKPDQDYDGLPPPGSADETDDDVDFVLMLLEHAARKTDVAFNVSTALCFLQNQAAKRDGKRIYPRQRDKLLAALIWARAPIVDMFETSSDRRLAAKGLDATGALICLWAETHEQIAVRRKRGSLSDIDACARWLRNACHNLSLLREIRERATDRRSATVADILRRAAA